MFRQRILVKMFIVACVLCGVASGAYASGSAYRLAGYALAGANPKVVFVVTDSNQNGVRGVAITVTCTTGTLDVVSGSTAADGTFTVNQSGAALGSHIIATSGSLINSPLTVISAAAAAMGSADQSFFWFDESRRLANAVDVTSGKWVLTSNSTFWFYPSDNSSSNGRDLTISQTYNQPLSQTANGPAQVEVYQGTFTNGDSFSLYDAVNGRWVSGGNWGLPGQGTIFFSVTQPSHYLYAYAVDGASPTVCAVVTDTNGVGVSGITVSITATAGTFSQMSDVTGDSGRVYFYQQGGSLGDTITVSCNALTVTSPVRIITQSSQPVQTTDKLFSWFSRKSRRIYTAVVNRQTNVLATSTSAPSWPANYVFIGTNPDPPAGAGTGAGVYVDQTSQQPAMAAIPHGSTVSGDLFRTQASTINRYPNNYTSNITLPAAEANYLLAFATGGANPTVWAAITDANGSAVKGVTVSFALLGTGSLATASGPTSWNGMIANSLSGAAAVGNTITVTATGLGTITIVTSDSQAVTTSDRVYSWYDPETHKIIGAVVSMATNVMTVAGTSVGGTAGKNSTGIQIPNLGYSLANAQNAAQTATQPFIGHAGFGTIGAGDFIRITQGTTSNTYDTHILAAGDPAKFLVAFATGGLNPYVWAVVMDNKGNGLESEPVTFATNQGSFGATPPTATSYGGYCVATLNGAGSYGNTISVSAPGLPPVTIYTSLATPAGGYNDNGVAWYDASRMTIWGSSFDEANHVMETSQSWYDWNGFTPPPGGGPVVTYTSGALKVNRAQAFDVTRKINQLAQWTIAFGTANVGDELWVDLALIKSYIHINSVKPSYLRAYANPGMNPAIKAIVVDSHGVGIPNVSVNFTAPGGHSMLGSAWHTGLDGSVDSAETGGTPALGDVLTVSSPGYPDAQVQTNNSGVVGSNSSSVFWFDPNSRRLNSVMLNLPWHNVIVTTPANIQFVAQDQSANNKNLAISGPKEDFAQSPTYGFAAPGTSGAGDKIWVQNSSTWSVNAGLLTLPADLSRYLWAFAAGEANPKVWAAVTDANGNGISGVPIHMIYPGPFTVDLATDAAGVTTNTRAGIALGNNISIAADGIANTINVTVAHAVDVDTSARTVGWYDVLSRTGYGAFVTVPNNVLAASTSAAITPVDATPNGLTFALGASTQQTAAAPASVLVSNGTQGQGDIIQFEEGTSTAAPDLQISINVPASGIYSSLTASPNPAITGNYISVTMTVFNNGTPDALSVSPTALGVTGGNATYFSGPVPAFWATIPGGQSKSFVWTYQASAPGGVTFTGQAFGTDAYTLNNVTSTPTNSNPILVRNPVPPVLTAALAAPGTPQVTGSHIYVTMTVTNTSAAEVGSPLNVSPTALTLAGSAVLISGPLPPNADIPGQGGQQQFVWEYRLTAPTGVTFTGQAYTLNPFDHTGVTSTATNAFVAVGDPAVPVITTLLTASPAVESVGQTLTVTMQVTNASSADVPNPLTITPLPLAASGMATLLSGPLPPSVYVPRGSSDHFTWSYIVTSPGSLTVTGQAMTVNPFDYSGVTSTVGISNAVIVQTPPLLTGTFVSPPNANRLLNFNFTLTIHNTGQATAISVTPVNLFSTGSVTATPVSGPVPAQRTIPGGGSGDFTWTYTAGDVNGTLQYSAQANGYDANTGVLVNAAGVTTTVINVIQGALNLDSVSSVTTEAYRGQKGLLVTLRARNTSSAGVTLTAAALSFNGSPNGYIVTPDAGNPRWLSPSSAFTLQFQVEVGQQAALGTTVVDGAIAGDAGPAGTMSANGAPTTAAWRILEAFNQLHQNYPNPLRLSHGDHTTFDYFLQDDVPVTLKLYNLAGELVAILVDGRPGVGKHTVEWRGDNGEPGRQGQIVGSGVYLAVLKAGAYQEIKKVVVIR